ncbi:MAG: hypothetical protein ACM3SY_02160 [Candidatus Omnitrophota bacterium]
MMKTEYKPIVLFYPTGIVHMRNLEILRKSLPGFRFMVIVEPWLSETAMEALNVIDKQDRVIIENNRLPAEVWKRGVRMLFLSMAYPNPFRLHLVYEAISRSIPIVSIEEVNQLALNDGIINHYFLPVDYLGVASDIEKEKFRELGIPGENIMVTGWPFYEDKAARPRDTFNIRSQYKVRSELQCCVLILGSLKELDMVSLETRNVRREILEIVSGGLAENFQLFIKPHPIETDESLYHIRKMLPNAHILDPRFPIEPLLEQADIVVNRGNSQVALLALKQSKPIIVTPVGLKTIFHGVLDRVIADSPVQFRRILGEYSWGKHEDYREILSRHLPLAHGQSLQKVSQLFATVLKDRASGMIDKKIYISILYAFLEDIEQANAILDTISSRESTGLLKKLFNKTIALVDFISLLDFFPGKMIRWHLQALFLRALFSRKTKTNLSLAAPLLKGFDGDVNPHYFMDDLIKRIELEYRVGNSETANKLFEKFYTEYSIFDYYRQAFDMLDFTYRGKGNSRWIRKVIWFLKNFNKPFARRTLKRKLTRSV